MHNHLEQMMTTVTSRAAITHEWDYDIARRFMQSLAMQGTWRAYRQMPRLGVDCTVNNGRNGMVEVWVLLPVKKLMHPERPVNCMVCGETEHTEMDCPYLHGRARHVCDDTCPEWKPAEATHEHRYSCFSIYGTLSIGCPEYEHPEFPIYVDAQANEHGEF